MGTTGTRSATRRAAARLTGLVALALVLAGMLAPAASAAGSPDLTITKTSDAGGTLTMTALTNGQIQAGDLFSTDPGLVSNNLVALEDDKSLFAAENVVPVIKTAKENDTITKTLNAVSAKLTTDDLIKMNAEAATGTNLADIAKKWLAGAGISGS